MGGREVQILVDCFQGDFSGIGTLLEHFSDNFLLLLVIFLSFFGGINVFNILQFEVRSVEIPQIDLLTPSL